MHTKQSADELPASEAPNPKRTRSHVGSKVWFVCLIISLERATFYGVTAPQQNYVQNPISDSFRPGALGLGQSKAVAINYAFALYTFFTSLIGGLVADCWLGRYKTIRIGLLFYVFSMASVMATAFTVKKSHASGLAGFLISRILLGMAIGAVRPNISVFMIEQLEDDHDKIITLDSGKKKQTNQKTTIQYVYSVNYWVINAASITSLATAFLEEKKGFGYAFMLPFIYICIATLFFFAAGSSYNIAPPPKGNNLSKALVLGLRQLRRRLTRRKNQQQPAHQNSTEQKSLAEVKAALHASLILSPFSIFTLCMGTMNNNLVAQAGQMQTYGLPNDIMMNLNPISILIILPFFQGLLYPLSALIGFPLTAIRRVSIGLFLMAFGMAYSSGLQSLIYASGPCYNRPLKCESGKITGPNTVNVWLQVPTYVLLAIGEVLAQPAGFELAYTQAPASMKSIIQAVFNLYSAVGSLIGVGVSFAAEDPNMVYVYAALAAAMFAVALAFVFATTFAGLKEK